MALRNDARRDEIFEVICDYSRSHLGNSPSMRDLLAELQRTGYKISLATLQYHLAYLEGAGALERRDGKLLIINSNWTPPPDK